MGLKITRACVKQMNCDICVQIVATPIYNDHK